jgi:hypothetical protein
MKAVIKISGEKNLKCLHKITHTQEDKNVSGKII